MKRVDGHFLFDIFFQIIIFFVLLGPVGTATFNLPCGLIFDASSINLYVANFAGNTIRQVCDQVICRKRTIPIAYIQNFGFKNRFFPISLIN